VLRLGQSEKKIWREAMRIALDLLVQLLHRDSIEFG
jgi:hypothetical protein